MCYRSEKQAVLQRGEKDQQEVAHPKGHFAHAGWKTPLSLLFFFISFYFLTNAGWYQRGDELTMLKVAKKEKAGAVAHGCTGKGNDQVRFEVTFNIKAPALKVLAPVREWGAASRRPDALVCPNQRGISPSSISVIQRKIIALQESGLERMFGKPSVRLEDLGGLNVLNLSDARSDMAVTMAPAFLLQKLFASLPEVGDVEMPQFVIFFDEAHYLFKDANRSLRDAMVTMLRQIRSKGVSVFFVTQDVTDIPDEILGQLSTKIMFAQKPMTEKGNARLRALAKSWF